MRNSLYWKLVGAFMLAAFASAALVVIFIRLTSVDRLTQLIVDQQRSVMEEALSAYYGAEGDWDHVARDWRDIQRLVFMAASFQNEPQQLPDIGDNLRDRSALFGLADADGMVVVAVNDKQPAGTQLSQWVLRRGTDVTVDEVKVGTILTADRLNVLNPEERVFLRRTNQALLLAMAGALVLALILGVPLARRLTQPLQALTRAAQGITHGQLQQQVAVDSQDEIGQLAEAFNAMSSEVARVNQMRRQLTADIAHDLRTPLTVIAGYIESMRDGVLQPTPERMTLIYSEIERLQNMVGDLRVLSQADAGELPLNPQLIDPGGLLRQAAEVFQHAAARKGVALAVQAGENLPPIRADEARLMQVLDNLLSNALRHTPQGGQILLSAGTGEGRVRIAVEDNGEGIAPEDLPHIFERFRRGDRSRHSEAGESGLGLAIVKALVEVHGGRVWAESRVEQGTSIHLEFPPAG